MSNRRLRYHLRLAVQLPLVGIQGGRGRFDSDGRCILGQNLLAFGAATDPPADCLLVGSLPREGGFWSPETIHQKPDMRFAREKRCFAKTCAAKNLSWGRFDGPIGCVPWRLIASIAAARLESGGARSPPTLLQQRQAMSIAHPIEGPPYCRRALKQLCELGSADPKRLSGGANCQPAPCSLSRASATSVG